MKGTVVVFAILILGGASAAHASSLQVFAGAVGGAGNGDINNGCTTYSGPFPTFFGSASSFSTPIGGIAPCAYFGGTSNLSSAAAPLSTSQSVAGVLLSDGTYDGSASSHANYGILGAAANGTFTASLSSTVLDNAMGAGFFTDTLALSSPNVVNSGNGFIRYEFTVHGSLTTGSGPNREAALLFLSYNNGGIDHFFQAASTSNGGPASDSINGSSTAPAGYTFTANGLSGSAAFDSGLYPLVFGSPESVEVGLLAEVIGSGSASFSTTAELTGIFVYDANGDPITDFTVSSESGTQYGASGVISSAPEPGTFLLLGTALLAVAWQRRRARFKVPLNRLP